MNIWVKNLLPFIAVIILGIALTFAFAPYEIFPFAILIPMAFMALLIKSSPTRAFCLGLMFGLGFFGAGVYWVFHSIHDIGGVPAAFALTITSGMIFILALYPASVAYFTQRYFPLNTTSRIILSFPAIWVTSEWIRSWLFTGFPWLFLGYSQTNSPLKGFAPLLSVYGVTFAVLISSSLLLQTILAYKQKKYQTLYLCLFAIVTIWTAGELFSLIPWTKPQGKPITVALVQGNIPQTLKWSPEHLQLSLKRYVDLTSPLWGKNDLIIWPEAAVPLPLDKAADYVEYLDQKAQATHSQLILGIPIPASNEGYYNAIITLGKDKKAYLKRRLVPFGEYTPFSNLFARALNFLNVPMSDMVAGKNDQDFLTYNDIKISASVCYEVAFPELMRIRDKSVGFLITLNNDAWFGKSNAQAQHLQMAQMRAIEMERPVVFVSNDGITALITADGNISASIPAYETNVLTGRIQPTQGLTPWMFNGIDPLTFFLFCLLVFGLRTKYLDKRSKASSPGVDKSLKDTSP